MRMNLKSMIMAGVLAATASLLSTSCASRQGRPFGQYLQDRKTAYAVKGALKDAPVYKFPDVNVTSFDQRVQLRGEVQTEDQRNRAGEIASTVSGVKEVVNNLEVRPSGQILSPVGRTNAPVRMGQPALSAPDAESPNHER